MTNEFIYGKNSVEALLKESDRSINKVYILSTLKKDGKVNNIINLANKRKIPVSIVSKDKFNSILKKNQNHQGVLASVSPVEYADLDETLEKIKLSAKKPVIVILDNIEDPQNVGSIVRSSEVLGVDAIVIPQRRGASITGVVAKVSAGAIEYIPVIQVTNIVKTIEKLKQEGFWVFGAEYEAGSKYIYEEDLTISFALVMGSEGKGISRLVKETCDIMIKIPQVGQTTSLNVANALSIILYEALRQRTSQ